MPSIEIDPRWRAQVEGDVATIANLERVLIGSITGSDSYVLVPFAMAGLEPLSLGNVTGQDSRASVQPIRSGPVPVLTTTKWDGLSTPAEAEEAAKSALRLLSGALNIFDVCAPLSIGTIYEVKADKSIVRTRRTDLQIYVAKDNATQVTPGDFARAIQCAEQHEWLTSAFIEMSGKVDWFSLYRAIEAIESYFGGEKGMTSDTRIDGGKLKRSKRMANSFRHLSDGKHQPPNPPISIDEATSVVRQSLEVLMRAIL